jgi:hypothetical protein
VTGRYDRKALPPRFSPEEIADAAAPADRGEEKAILEVVRQLERVAAEPSPRVDARFLDRVNRAIAAEPQPAPLRAARASLRKASLGGIVAALRATPRVAFGAGRPGPVRGQAFALLIVVILAAGSVTGAAAFTAGHLLEGPAPANTIAASPSVPAAGPSASPSPSPKASASPSPGRTPGTDPAATPVDTESPYDGGGATPQPTAHPTQRETQQPESGSSHSSSTETPSTPRPTASGSPH